MTRKYHFYTEEQLEYLKEISPSHSSSEITKMLNEKFGLNQTKRMVSEYRRKHRIPSKYSGKQKTDGAGNFIKGHAPWNKGRKGIDYPGMQATQFKKGHRPANRVPIGTERVTVDGYTEIKIQDGKGNKNWKAKQEHIWEQEHGPKPPGHVILFGDGDKSNFDIDNLLLVSRKQLARINQHGLIGDSVEITKTGIIIADVYNKIGERKGENNG